jgi:hypothetical protein
VLSVSSGKLRPVDQHSTGGERTAQSRSGLRCEPTGQPVLQLKRLSPLRVQEHRSALADHSSSVCVCYTREPCGAPFCEPPQ